MQSLITSVITRFCYDFKHLFTDEEKELVAKTYVKMGFHVTDYMVSCCVYDGIFSPSQTQRTKIHSSTPRFILRPNCSYTDEWIVITEVHHGSLNMGDMHSSLMRVHFQGRNAPSFVWIDSGEFICQGCLPEDIWYKSLLYMLQFCMHLHLWITADLQHQVGSGCFRHYRIVVLFLITGCVGVYCIANVKIGIRSG